MNFKKKLFRLFCLCSLKFDYKLVNSKEGKTDQCLNIFTTNNYSKVVLKA